MKYDADRRVYIYECAHCGEEVEREEELDYKEEYFFCDLCQDPDFEDDWGYEDW